MKQEKILVIGARGTVGSILSKLLKQKNYAVVEATSQKEQALLPHFAYVNLATGEGIQSAMDQVDRAFFLSPPGYADQYKMLSPLIQAAQKAQLKKVVLMTAMGANAVETSPFRRAEIELENSGVPYNIIRPNWFFQNFNTFWIQGIQNENKIFLPAGLAKTSFIDARDIAKVAAQLLTTDLHNGKDFDLTGPEALDHHAVAKALSEVTGRSISYEDIPPERLKQNLLMAGLPSDYVDFLLMIFGFLREGYSSKITPDVQLLTGDQPLCLANYAEDFKTLWMKS